jgi:hypothetical protein
MPYASTTSGRARTLAIISFCIGDYGDGRAKADVWPGLTPKSIPDGGISGVMAAQNALFEVNIWAFLSRTSVIAQAVAAERVQKLTIGPKWAVSDSSSAVSVRHTPPHGAAESANDGPSMAGA